MKNLLKTILGSLVLGSVLVGIIAVVGSLVEWLCADAGRYILGLLIASYGVYKCFKAEFDR